MHTLLVYAVTSALLQGDPVPQIGRVTSIRAVAIDDAGHCIIDADTDYPSSIRDEVLLRDGVVLVREDDTLPTPPGARADSLTEFATNASGDVVAKWLLDGDALGANDRGVYWGTTIMLQEGDVCTAPELTAGTLYKEFDAAKPAPHASRIAVVATVDDVAIPSTFDRALVSVLHDGAGAVLAEHVVVAEGDTLPGTGEPVQDVGRGRHECAIDDDGHVLYFADLAGDVAHDGCICLDSVVLAREGDPSPVPGRNYEFLVGRGKDLAAGGHWIAKANLGGDTFDDELLVKDGAVLAREGQSLPDIVPWTLTSFGVSAGPVWLDDQGRALWFGEWDDPDTTQDAGLFLDGNLLVRESAAEVYGIPIVAISSGPGAVALSADGSKVIFRGRLADDREGAFTLDLGAVVDVAERPFADLPVLALAAAPNPFRDSVRLDFFAPPGASPRVTVLDLGGRLVRGLAEGATRWDGRDDSGRPLPSGVYVVRMEAGGRSAARKIVLVR